MEIESGSWDSFQVSVALITSSCLNLMAQPWLLWCKSRGWRSGSNWLEQHLLFHKSISYSRRKMKSIYLRHYLNVEINRTKLELECYVHSWKYKFCSISVLIQRKYQVSNSVTFERNIHNYNNIRSTFLLKKTRVVWAAVRNDVKYYQNVSVLLLTLF